MAVNHDDDAIFREIADYTYDLESWIAPDGKTKWVNPAVERITGYTVDECLSHADYPYFFVHPEDQNRMAVALEHAQKHISGNDLEFRIIRKDGAIRWGAISWQDLNDAEGVYRGYRTSVRDITSRKSGEYEILASRDEAHRASKAKSEFLATMSHEIRTPIQNVLGYAQLLRRTELSPLQERYLSILAEQGEHLLRVVDDILDFSALQSISLRIEQAPFDLRECVHAVVNSARPSAEKNGLDLTVEFSTFGPTVCEGDAHRLRQILGNLVSNAIKFTETGEVRVIASLSRDPSNLNRATVCITVSDTGIGMNSEQLSRLYEPFTQGDASISRRYGGSGLGLNICKRLTELMGGRIDIVSQPDRGTTVTVRMTLPLVADNVSAQSAAVSDVDRSHLPILDVLVVDDTAVARQMTVELLTATGQVCHSVGNGKDALAALHAYPFALVLMDKRMPDLDGLQLTRMIRRDPSIAQPYIVALTANVLPAARQACLEAGMDAFQGKPMRISDLERIIQETATRKNADDAKKSPEDIEAFFDPQICKPLLATQGGKPSILARQFPTIERELERDEAFFREQLDLGVFGAMGQRAHAVRGSLLAIGARRAADTALALEHACDEAHGAALHGRVLALCLALARTRLLLRMLVGAGDRVRNPG